MSIKIKLLEAAKVFDFNDFKADPISELNAGAEIIIESIMKDWKIWRKITLPDGRKGLISVQTKAQVLEYETLEATNCGSWSNFKKVLMSDYPDQYGFDMPVCIKEFEDDIRELIQTSKKPEAVILACISASADYLLKADGVTEKVVDSLTKKALKSDWSSIEALIKIEKIQNKELISNEMINLLIEKARKPNTQMEFYAGLLIEIARLRQSNQLVADILDVYRTTKDDYITYAGFRSLYNITKDNRIIDFLITQLDRGFRVDDKSVLVQSLSDLFLNPQTWGPAYYASEELLAIGEARGISEIVPHLLKFVGEYDVRVSDYKGSINEIVDWHIRYRNTLIPHPDGLSQYLSEDSTYESRHIREYIELVLKKVMEVEGNSNKS